MHHHWFGEAPYTEGLPAVPHCSVVKRGVRLVEHKALLPATTGSQDDGLCCDCVRWCS
jgi:hypothetical protein